MDIQEQTKQKQTNKKEHRKKQNRYSYEYKLKAVKLALEEDYTANFLAGQLGIGISSVYTWIKRYRALGDAGLKDCPTNLIMSQQLAKIG